MSQILRVKLKWSGFAGAPGYSNFFYKGPAETTPDLTHAEAAAAAVGNFASYVRTYLPIEASLQVQSDVEMLNDADGEMQTVLNVAPRAVQQGQAASAPYSAASGAVITWRTGGVRKGRRVRGRTFLVPLANSAYQSDGTLSAAVVTSLNTNMAAFLSGSGVATLGVWARPTTKDATDGVWYAVNGFSVPDKVAILRSRRD